MMFIKAYFSLNDRKMLQITPHTDDSILGIIWSGNVRSGNYPV